MTALIEHARAKVNLTLRVVGRRVDGYHDLESVVAFAECADCLEFHPGDAFDLVVTGPTSAGCGASANNLVMRGAQRLAERIPELKKGRFILDKHLPVAAGVGGGSADAAAALRCLARANAIALDDPRLHAVACEVGADVPVCLSSRACVMSGIGDNLAPLTLPRMPCVLVNPGVAVSTLEVFAALGLRNGELLVGTTDIFGAADWPGAGAGAPDWLAMLATHRNDLEKPAVQSASVIGDVLVALRGMAGARLARMSGSGATCFAIFSSDDEAAAAATQLQRDYPQWWVNAGALS